MLHNIDTLTVKLFGRVRDFPVPARRLPLSAAANTAVVKVSCMMVCMMGMYLDSGSLTPGCGRISSESDRKSWTIFIIQNLFFTL